MPVKKTPSSPLEIVAELSRRFMAGDREGALALLHPDVRVEQPPSLPHGGTHVGLSGMATMGEAFAAHWTRTIEEPRHLACGDTVVQITRQTWSSLATGRAATVDVVELLKVVDGRVVEIRVFPQDTHRLLATLEAP